MSMATKNNPGPHDCYRKALPHEPIFTLLARDDQAPNRVDDWALQRELDVAAGRRPPEDLAVVKEARECAASMRRWRTEHDGEWRGVKPKLYDRDEVMMVAAISVAMGGNSAAVGIAQAKELLDLAATDPEVGD